MRCPICRSELDHVLIRDIGSPAPNTVWQVHAGECPQHGWFQAEVISRPPREIFAVTKPFGAARRVIVGGREYFSFPTVWNALPGERKREPTDPLDPEYWNVELSDN